MESGGNDQTIYEFEDFRLIPGEGLLMHKGVPVVLQPKAFAVLELLVRRNGHLVTRSEIIDTIWEESYVEEAAVSKAVYYARHALSDSSKLQFIQTVSRRGYRFVAPVKILNSPEKASSETETISTGYRLKDLDAGRSSVNGSIEPGPTTDANVEVFERSDPSIKPAIDSLPKPTDELISGQGLFRRRHLIAISALVLLATVFLAAYTFYPWSDNAADGGAGSTVKRGTNNEKAYQYYLLAQNFNELRGPEHGRTALEQIDQAVALDPNFARAWATKAYIHRYLAYGPVAIEHSLKSIDAAEKALAIDPNLSEAHSALCFNKFRFEYDFEAAERSCKRAIELDPNSALAHKLYSNFLYTRGRFDESLAEIKKAIDLQPVSYDNHQTYALALYFARKYSEAETQLKQLIPLNPNHGLIYGQLVRTLVQQRKETEALEYLIKLLTLEKENEETIRQIRDIYTRSGWRGVTLERIRIAESHGNARPYDLARLYAVINEKDKAFKLLDQAFRERSTMIAVVEVDPELDLLRGDPRYTEFVRKIAVQNRYSLVPKTGDMSALVRCQNGEVRS